MLSAKALPAEGHTALAAFKADVDLGDHLFVHGRVISSRRGELSVMAEPVLREGAEAASAGDDDVEVPAWRIASKALAPPAQDLDQRGRRGGDALGGAARAPS